MPPFDEATADFERWLGAQLTIVKADLKYKHEQMAADVFRFLRATFYRWAQMFPIVCSELAAAPKVLAIGDLHVENFGTWRDIDGRLVWGVNDFDEAYPQPWPNDLVRLAASVKLAIETNALKIDPATAYKDIEDGYTEFIFTQGRPFVLAERTHWLKLMAEEHLRDPVAFWEKIDALPRVSATIPPAARALLLSSLPERTVELKIQSRRAGMGSLGRIRLVGSGMWRGGMIAREVKATALSACIWATGTKATRGKILIDEIRHKAVRCPDPVMRTQNGWIVRRLSPDCSKIDLAQMPKSEERRVLHAMGRETANIHLGSASAIAQVRADLKKRQKQSPDWLANAAGSMAAQTRADWKVWQAKVE